MKNCAQKVQPNDSRSGRSSFLAAALGALVVAVSNCRGAAPAQDADSIWPTKEWQTASPEEQGMDSKELAELIDFGTAHGFDSVLASRHGRIVAEAYYAPYAAGIPHTINSCTKSIISTLTAIASKDGLLDSPSQVKLVRPQRWRLSSQERCTGFPLTKSM
jgi:hypothetical protein